MKLPLTVGVLVLSACQPALPVDDPRWVTTAKTFAIKQLNPDLMLLVDRSAPMGLPINPSAAQCPAGCGATSGACPAGCPTRLSEVAAGLGSFLDARGTVARLGMAAFPAPGATACNASTAGEVLVPLSSSKDVEAELTATAGEIKQKVAALSPAGPTSTGAALSSLGAYPPLHEQFREDFVLLVTGAPACDSDAAAAVSAMRRDNLKTIVVGLGPEFESGPGADALGALAEAGGFARMCPNGTDAECGSGNTCEPTTRLCSKKFFHVADGAALTAALMDLTRTLPPPPRPCTFLLNAVPESAAQVRVVANQVAVPADEPGGGWTINGGEFTFLGTRCEQVENSTALEPVRIEVYVFKP